MEGILASQIFGFSVNGWFSQQSTYNLKIHQKVNEKWKKKHWKILTGSWDTLQAKCKGLLLSTSVASGSAWFCSRAVTAAEWPDSAATCNGVCLEEFFSLERAPAKSKFLTIKADSSLVPEASEDKWFADQTQFSNSAIKDNFYSTTEISRRDRFILTWIGNTARQVERSAQWRVPDFGIGIHVDGEQKQNALQIVALDGNVQKVEALVVVLLSGGRHAVKDGLSRLVVATRESGCEGSQALLVPHREVELRVAQQQGCDARVLIRHSQMQRSFSFRILSIYLQFNKIFIIFNYVYKIQPTWALCSIRVWTTWSWPHEQAMCSGNCPSLASSPPSPFGPGRRGTFSSHPLKFSLVSARWSTSKTYLLIKKHAIDVRFSSIDLCSSVCRQPSGPVLQQSVSTPNL